MALFGQGGQGNQNRVQQQMFDKEIQLNREENALKYSDVGDDVYFAQKDKNENLTKWQQDMEEEIKRIVLKLKRQTETEDGSERIKVFKEYKIVDGKRRKIYTYAKPMMNEVGINMFIGALIPLISRNLMMSNYSEDKIYVKLRSVTITFISHLAYHQKDYNINVGDLSIIVRMFKDIAEPAHWRSLNDGERRHQETIRKMVEAVTYGGSQQNPQQRKGLLQGLMG